MTPLVPVSWGELLDKISILQIKAERVVDPAALANVEAELAALMHVAAQGALADPDIEAMRASLKQINDALWGIEDRIREKEAQQAFDAEFVELARSVYKTNDRRAAVKREINLHLKSALVEEKHYSSY